MGLIWYLWEDIKSQCDFMYLRKWFGLNFTLNSVLGQNESIHYESVHEAWELYMKSRESVTKDLWNTSINDLQSNILWKAINECEETTAFIPHKHISVPLDNACVFW